jgi:hypothetical protein
MIRSTREHGSGHLSELRHVKPDFVDAGDPYAQVVGG